VLKAGIGLHAGTVMGGILDAGGHSEFTVVGDAVNVAQRLQAVSKTFEASLVVSSDLLARVSDASRQVDWTHAASVEIPGRTVTLDIAYLVESVALHRKAARCDFGSMSKAKAALGMSAVTPLQNVADGYEPCGPDALSARIARRAATIVASVRRRVHAVRAWGECRSS